MTDHPRPPIGTGISPRLAALYGIRASVDALIIQEELDAQAAALDDDHDPEACPHCGAPSDFGKDISTLDGTRRRHCRRCGQSYILSPPGAGNAP